MTNRADIVLEQDQTRVIDDLISSTGAGNSPSLRFDPNWSNLEVGGSYDATGVDDQRGRIEVKDVKDGNRETMVSVRGFPEGGGLTIRGGPNMGQVGSFRAYDFDGSVSGAMNVNAAGNDSGVTLWTDHGVARGKFISKSGTHSITVDTENERGRITVNDEEGRDQVTVKSGDAGGEIVLNDEEGIPTGFVHGDDAAIELRGQPDQTDYEPGSKKRGGGELVLSAGGGNSVDTRVHISGDRTADYGTARDHRPMIFIDGPSGTAELGRGPQENGGDAVKGTVLLRDTAGDATLYARAESQIKGGPGEHVAEIFFGYSSEGNFNSRGFIRSHANGMMFYDANDDPAMLIDTNGDIKTANSIQEGVL